MSETKPIFLSVVIPTCHRNDLLGECLKRLAPGAQTLPANEYEVIVTDDGSKSSAREFVAQNFPFAIWVQGPRRGPAANRNNGAKQAQGEWIAFVDDDCLPATGWLAAIATWARAGDVDVVEGKTTCPDKIDSPFVEYIENLGGGVFWSCNLAVRRALFLEMGGFDEDFPAAGGEDMEFAWRIRHRQLRHIFAPAAWVEHPIRPMPWKKIWWRTLMIKWILLYGLKVGSSPGLDSSRAVVAMTLVRARIMDLLRTTWHLFTRPQPAGWKTASFQQAWKWLTFPIVLPYLVVWEFRFREMLRSRRKPA